nr:MAG TPA_asm: hypothetical protein [Caudoviricetes sp.]
MVSLFFPLCSYKIAVYKPQILQARARQRCGDLLHQDFPLLVLFHFLLSLHFLILDNISYFSIRLRQ